MASMKRTDKLNNLVANWFYVRGRSPTNSQNDRGRTCNRANSPHIHVNRSRVKSEPADQGEIFSMKRRRKVTIHVVIRRSTVHLIKRGKIFKENVMLRRWESIACNSVITTELKT